MSGNQGDDEQALLTLDDPMFDRVPCEVCGTLLLPGHKTSDCVHNRMWSLRNALEQGYFFPAYRWGILVEPYFLRAGVPLTTMANLSNGSLASAIAIEDFLEWGEHTDYRTIFHDYFKSRVRPINSNAAVASSYVSGASRGYSPDEARAVTVATSIIRSALAICRRTYAQKESFGVIEADERYRRQLWLACEQDVYGVPPHFKRLPWLNALNPAADARLQLVEPPLSTGTPAERLRASKVRHEDVQPLDSRGFATLRVQFWENEPAELHYSPSFRHYVALDRDDKIRYIAVFDHSSKQRGDTWFAPPAFQVTG